MIKILVIDDEIEMLNGVKKLLTLSGFDCITSQDGNQAIELLNDISFDLVISDLFMPDISGNQIIEQIKKTHPEIPIIIFTAFGTVERAVEAMKLGAYDFIEKPFESQHLIMKIKRAVELKTLRSEKENLISQLQDKYSFQNIIAKSQAMKNVFDIVEQVSPVDANVLITGESGTGKELIARAIHVLSKRKTGPFVPVNCGAFPENLFESELFGYEKGAFTGAANRKIGFLEYADSGTFFMDEVFEIPAHIQAKLLRALQERKLTRVGGNTLIDFNVRIIAATNKDLQKAIENGELREDFYFRINVVQIHIPPLRERKIDIPLLADYFISKSNESTKKNISGIDERVLNIFENYSWPGNVRELENVIQSASVFCQTDKITPADLPKYLFSQSTQSDFEKLSLTEAKQLAIEKIERDFLLFLMEKHSGNITKVAEESGMTRRNIYRIISKYRLNPDDWRIQNDQ
ncbi:MAG TPA: sigma-54 dependent transcriptional regulator [Ignavibacteriaceae bacterium]|nr:sigma-54 dependent transcriptional regulator [Ignavibacteriaceae bacterium]